jgi:hypothetical protein
MRASVMELVQRARERAHVARCPHRFVVRFDLLLQGVEGEELVDDRDHIQARREIARDDLPERIALAEVIALVMQHRAKLVGIEPFDERGGEADARTHEPVAEGERPRVGDDVDAAVKIEAARGRDDRRR